MTHVNKKKNYDIYIGIDVDKKSYAFTNKDRYDIMNKSKRIPADPNNFYNYITNNFKNKEVICAYEAGPTGYKLYDYLTEKGITCLVVSPNSIPKAPNDRVKNNRIDSRNLAKYLSQGELKSIRVPIGIYRELRHLITIREHHAGNRKSSKQRIKALLLFESLYDYIKDPKISWSNNFIKQLKKLKCSDAVRTRLDMLLMDLDYERKQTLSILKTIRNFSENNKEINQYMKYLISIPGIGLITAVTVLGRIGNPKYLKNVREIAAFAGLVPTERSTGDNIIKGSITHFGNKVLRSLLIEAAWISIRKDNKLYQFFHRIRSRNHPIGAKRKAIVSVARKLTQIIYRVLKDQRDFINY